MLDILIRGGTVIDGTGRPARRADVAIARDRNEAIELLPGAGAARVIDATGHVVAPGFVDMHSHADFVLPGLPMAESKVHQGFTLEVVGNCGASPAPLTPAEAIRKMTSLPAVKLGLRDRGRLEPGAVADVVVFDPATIADTATFAEPHQYPRGIPWVLVNGEPVIAGGRHTGSRPGRVLAR